MAITTWTSEDMDWTTTLVGKPLLPYAEALRLALLERWNIIHAHAAYAATVLPWPSILSTPVTAEYHVPHEWPEEFDDCLRNLFSFYVDDTYLTNIYYGVNGTSAPFIYKWTVGNINVACSTAIASGHTYFNGGIPILASWAAERYILLNRLRYTQVHKVGGTAAGADWVNTYTGTKQSTGGSLSEANDAFLANTTWTTGGNAGLVIGYHRGWIDGPWTIYRTKTTWQYNLPAGNKKISIYHYTPSGTNQAAFFNIDYPAFYCPYDAGSWVRTVDAYSTTGTTYDESIGWFENSTVIADENTWQLRYAAVLADWEDELDFQE